MTSFRQDAVFKCMKRRENTFWRQIRRNVRSGQNSPLLYPFVRGLLHTGQFRVIPQYLKITVVYWMQQNRPWHLPEGASGIVSGVVVFVTTTAWREMRTIRINRVWQWRHKENSSWQHKCGRYKLCRLEGALTFRLNLEDKEPMKHQRPLTGQNWLTWRPYTHITTS